MPHPSSGPPARAGRPRLPRRRARVPEPVPGLRRPRPESAVLRTPDARAEPRHQSRQQVRLAGAPCCDGLVLG
eukprot:scaffold33692_cov67-Isochrysis_galbana.AAC.1